MSYFNINGYGMFSAKGDRKVQEIVYAASQFPRSTSDEQVWKWVEVQLMTLSDRKGFEEAFDTDVRDQVHSTIVS
tara:strand:+ start:42 stop:266 length:225 start_codon:yes stop_codon:yes gene_type:complete